MKVLFYRGGAVNFRRPPEKKIAPSKLVWEDQYGKGEIRLGKMTDSQFRSAYQHLESNADLLAADAYLTDARMNGRQRKFRSAEDFLVRQDYYREFYREALRRQIPVAPITCWYALGYPLPITRLPRATKFRKKASLAA
jgi:hypothetical protein